MLKQDGIYSKLVFSFNKTPEWQHNVIFSRDFGEYFSDGIDGISMNTSDIYFWNDDKIWRYHMDCNEMHYLGLNVDRDDKITKIKKVRTGSCEDKVAVVIRQSKTSDFVMLWDIKNDNEIESFDHGLNPNVFWDFIGDAYQTEEDRVYISS